MKNIILFCCLFFFGINTYSQNDTTVFYIDYDDKKTEKENASFLRKQFLQDGKWTVNDYYLTGKLQMTGTYKNRRFKKKKKKKKWTIYILL